MAPDLDKVAGIFTRPDPLHSRPLFATALSHSSLMLFQNPKDRGQLCKHLVVWKQEFAWLKVHNKTAEISKNHAMVAVEDLQIRNLAKSAAGNAEKPGKNVAAKSGLNKAILDQGWFEFRRQLDWNGGVLIAVPPQYTSQTCPCCGHVAKANRKTQAQFECVDCGYKNNADVVGAMNILARGYRAAVCGEDGSGSVRKNRTKPASVKQEPAEAALASAMLAEAP